MSLDLLVESPTTTPVANGIGAVENLVREGMRSEFQVGMAIDGMKGSAETFENAWREIVLQVAREQTTAMHAARERLISAFERRLKLLKETHSVATWLRNMEGTHVPNPSVLLPEIESMECLKANVLDRWQTAEDLEDLAARDYPLSSADLEKIGAGRRPPNAYYAEDSKPF